MANNLDIVQTTVSDEEFWGEMKHCGLEEVIGNQKESIAYSSYQNYTSLTL